jgi:hypothetical protein
MLQVPVRLLNGTSLMSERQGVTGKGVIFSLRHDESR